MLCWPCQTMCMHIHVSIYLQYVHIAISIDYQDIYSYSTINIHDQQFRVVDWHACMCNYSVLCVCKCACMHILWAKQYHSYFISWNGIARVTWDQLKSTSTLKHSNFKLKCILFFCIPSSCHTSHFVEGDCYNKWCWCWCGRNLCTIVCQQT